MITLGVDPALLVTGFGVVKIKENGELLSLGYGSCKTDQSESIPGRLKKIAEYTEELVKNIKPDHIALEESFLHKNPASLLKLGYVRGIIMLVAAKQQIPLFEYSPRKIKKIVTGYGNADKNQVKQLVTQILKMKTSPESNDSADALAIAITHIMIENESVKIR